MPNSEEEGFKPSGNPEKTKVGIGMPATLYLDEYGSQLWSAFGHVPYQVGSTVVGTSWRDVDVRIILPDEEYAAMGFGDPNYPHENAKWRAYVMAFTELGRRMTGLPIDFQIQQQTRANACWPKNRSALGIIPLRRKQPDDQETAPSPPTDGQ